MHASGTWTYRSNCVPLARAYGNPLCSLSSAVFCNSDLRSAVTLSYDRPRGEKPSRSDFRFFCVCLKMRLCKANRSALSRAMGCIVNSLLANWLPPYRQGPRRGRRRFTSPGIFTLLDRYHRWSGHSPVVWLNMFDHVDRISLLWTFQGHHFG